MTTTPSARTAGTTTSLPLGAQLLRRKPIDQMIREAGASAGSTGAGNSGAGTRLRRSLGVWQLTMISVGATLGTGIFVVLGTSVPLAGPAIWISFVVAGLAALLCAVSYAEMAGAVPVSGSSYSYAYATMGEGIAWVCGWCLVLEYAVSVAAVAVGGGRRPGPGRPAARPPRPPAAGCSTSRRSPSSSSPWFCLCAVPRRAPG